MHVPEYRAASSGSYPLGLEPGGVHSITKALALTCVLLALWVSTHRYHGLVGDAALYAVQALARLHSNLYHDLFLEHISQDTYTIFSPLYAASIALVGLHVAALMLTVIFKLWFFAAAWALARCFSQNHVACLTVALFIVIAGGYGAYGVFRYAEDWVTARSLAEALVIAALACYLHSWRVAGLLTALSAMFVHPLMALPGLLLLACLWSSLRANMIAAGGLILLSLAVALCALRLPHGAYFLGVMDADWLSIVRERSQFLFPQLWSAADWELNARPFLSLMLSMLAIGDPRIFKLCASAMLVGATGFAVALIAGLIGPVGLLLQGQAWRWVWVTTFVAILLLAPTVLDVRRDEKCGLLCMILVFAAWTIPAVNGSACLAGALLLWLARRRLDARAARCLRWLGYAGGALICGWAIKSCWVFDRHLPAESDVESAAIALFRGALGVKILSVLISWGLIYWLKGRRSMPALITASATLLGISGLLLPGTFHDRGLDGTLYATSQFADWRSAIPPDSNVFVVPTHNSAAFAWFTLERPSYLTVDQSSGVVFSRATAMEVRRRSEVLRPLMDPDWTLMSDMRKIVSGGPAAQSPRPLTRNSLMRLCQDPALNFVVSKENLDVQHLRHDQPGNWKDWNLYDCRRVRA